MSNANISDPIPLPDPQIGNCLIQSMRVLSQDNRIVDKMVMQTALGNFYELGRDIRETIFGRVVHAIHLTRGVNNILIRDNPLVNIAIKVYQRSKLRELHGRTHENPSKELSAMQFVNTDGGHDNVISLIECCADNANIFAIMEFCDGGELYDIVEMNRGLTETLARNYMKQIINGLIYLHSLPLCHRDMSLENVLVTTTGVCKIIDLGMSLRMGVSRDGLPLPMPFQGICGKRNYIAPELLANLSPYNPLLGDIWALGVMLFIMVTGVPPMDYAIASDARYRMICQGNLKFMLDQWGIRVSDSVVHLINIILRPRPQERPTLQDILNHPWMQIVDEGVVDAVAGSGGSVEAGGGQDMDI